jgi:hypothetical protein
MIGIKLEGQNELLDTLPDTQISMRLENPLLGDDARISPGSYTLPFELPGGNTSPKNSALLKNPDVIENNEAYQPQRATLLFNNVPFRKGTLQSTDTGQDRISSNFLFGLSQVDEKIKTAKLRDIINQNISIDSNAITKKIYLKRITSGDYNVTINGKNYTAASITGLRTLINADFEASLDTGVYMPFATVISTGTTPSGLISASYLELKPAIYYTFYDDVLEMEFQLSADSTDPHEVLNITTDEPASYQVEGFDMSTYYSAFDTFFSGYISGTYPTEIFRIPAYFNANAYNDQPVKQGELVNGINSSGIIRNNANWGLTNAQPFTIRNFNSIQPFVRLKWLLNKIAEVFNFTIDGDFYEHPDVDNMLIDNSTSLDVVLPFIGTTPFIFWRRSFNVNELLPDLSVITFLQGIASRYNVGMYYNERTRNVTMQFREEIAKSIQYEDITSISSPIRPVKTERITGFMVKVPKEDTDTLSFDETKTVGTPQREIQITCGRLWQVNAVIIDGVAVTGPRVSRKTGDKFGLRIFHYKGIVSGSAFNYPGADINGTIIYEALNDFILQQGIYTRFHQYWLLFEKNRRLVNVEMNLPFRSIINIEWDLKKRYNRSNFLLKSIDVKLTNTGMRVSNVELITMA